MKWIMQAGNLTTNLKFKTDFTLPEFSVKTIVKWEWHVDESAKSTYDMILGRYLLTSFGFSLKLSEHVIRGGEILFEGSTSSLADLGMYEFKYLNTGKITSE